MAATTAIPGRFRPVALPGGVALLSVLVLGPALAPGYVLTGDQVFVPDQSLLPWMLGLGGGLPRSVPQDAVVAVLTGPVPGWVWETLALLGALLLLGTGVARLLGGAGLVARAVGATVAVWSPYVAERLLLGHWSLLLAVGVLPWALATADDARRARPAAGARWVLWLGLASLTPTGGLLVLVTTAPVLLWRASASPRHRGLLVAVGVLLQLPWLVPALLHPAAAPVGGAEVFALRAEGWWGPVLTALGTGGAWNADAAPGSRATLLAPLLTVALLALAWYGRRATVRRLGRPVATTLAVVAGVLLAVVVLGAFDPTAPLVRTVVEAVPGGGLLRDAQKWSAPWLVLLACAAGAGAGRLVELLTRRSGDRVLGRVAAVGLLVLPVVGLPDLAWGALGRLASVVYPPDWEQAREVLLTDPAPGDVVSLPWSAFRRYGWNLGRTVLDPAPRAMPRTVVADDTLPVGHHGSVVLVPGDDPRAARIGAVVGHPDRLAATLREIGVGWVLRVHVPGPEPTLPTGAQQVLAGPDLDLYRLPAPVRDPGAGPARTALVLTADGVALLVLAGAAAVAGRARFRRRRAAPIEP